MKKFKAIRNSVLPWNRVVLAVSCASVKMRRVVELVRYVCVMIGSAVHKDNVDAVAESLASIAKCAITVEYPRRMR